MNTRHIVLGGFLAGAVTIGGAPALDAAMADKMSSSPVVSSAVKARAPAPFVSNAPTEPSLTTSTTAANVAPSALGTAGNYTTIFYWLDGHNELSRHVGNRVEIEGELESEPREGDIKIDRKEKWTEITVKADGRTMKANVPHTSSLPAPGKDGDSKSDILVRRVDVGKVRMLAASCAP